MLLTSGLYALCIILFMIGHMVRDGWPALHSTHGARAAGAAICLLGAFLVLHWPIALLVGAAMWIGYYFDMKHGEGQGPDDSLQHLLHNEEFLPLSGLTSVLPLAGVVAYAAHDWKLVLIAAAGGIAKMLIWPAMWNLLPRTGLMKCWMIGDPEQPKESFFSPTRIAAMVFGGFIAGALIDLILRGTIQ